MILLLAVVVVAVIKPPLIPHQSLLLQDEHIHW